VSAEETRLILANHPKYQECRQQFITQISEAMPTIAQIFLRGVTDTDNRIIALLQKKLRWGEFLQQWKQANVESRAELQAEGQRIIASLEQSHEAELTRRQAAIQAFGEALRQYGQTQAAIANQRRAILCNTYVTMPGHSSTTSCY
jgi:hypothetical protein